MTDDATTPDAAPEGWEYPAPPTAYDLVRDSFPMRAGRTALHLCFRASMRLYHSLHCVGREHVLDTGPCVIAPNHTSLLDNIAVLASLPLRELNRTYSVGGKDYFFENVLLALVARLTANGIPIDRSGTSQRGLRMCARKLRAGGRIIIFPEGARTKTGAVGRFKPGAVGLSRGLKVPVVPTYLKGTFESMSRFMVLPRGRKITVVYGEPMRFWEGELADLDHRAAAKLLEDRVRELQREHDPAAFAAPPT